MRRGGEGDAHEDASMQTKGEGRDREYQHGGAGMEAGGGPRDYQRAGDEPSKETEGEIEGMEGKTGGEEAEGESGTVMEVGKGASMEAGAESGAGEEMGKGTEKAQHSGGGGAAQLQQYLRGVDYPADKQDMIDTARSNSAPDDFMSFMNRLPDKTYNRPTEVEQEFSKIK